MTQFGRALAELNIEILCACKPYPAGPTSQRATALRHLWHQCEHRQSKYHNNVIEADHGK